MMKEKNVPLKNYIVLAGVLILSIILIVYFYMWYGAYEKNKLTTPIMDKYLTVINYNELDNYLVENKDAIIYVSKLGDEEIRIFEKKFRNVVDDYSFNSSILYLNLTSELGDNSFINDFQIKYDVSDLPSIVVFKDGVLDEIYNIKANAYDIDNLITYLTGMGVMND